MNDQQAASLPPHIEKAFIYALEQMQACEARLSVMIERHQQAWKQVGAEPSVVAEEELSNAQAEMFSGYDEMNLAIEAFDAVLHKYGINPSDFETPLPQQKKRLWEKDLQPEVVPKDSDRMEDGLQSGLQRLLEIFPRAWVKPQLLKGEALMHARGTQEPFLLGGISAEPMMHDRFGYGLTLAIALIERDPHFDMYEAPTLVPQISMLCQLLDALLSVQGGLEKLRELQKAPSGEVDSRIYELLVAARAAEVGRKVSFVPAKPGAPTPDLRIHDMYFPVVIECKLQNRRSEVETVAVALLSKSRSWLTAYKSKHPSLLGDLRVRFTVPIRDIQVEEVCCDLEAMWNSLHPFQEESFAWGAVEWRYLESHVQLEAEVKAFCPLYLKQVLPDYMDIVSDWDGLVVLVNGQHGPFADEVAMPFCMRWRLEHPVDETAMARNVVRHLREAIDQIPLGEAGVLYIGLLNTLRSSIADRRTEVILDTLPEFVHTRRGVIAPMAEINRLYPHVMDHGLPDLIESVIPATQDKERSLHRYFPTLIFTRGDGADLIDVNNEDAASA